jgi:hypothetical protein
LVLDSGFGYLYRVQGLWFRVEVYDSGFRVYDLGLRVEG